jgi:hypothetical protein
MPSSRVSDEQVERACVALWGKNWEEGGSPEWCAAQREHARKALESALAEPEGEADGEVNRWEEVLAAGLRAYYTGIGVETNGLEFRNLCHGFLQLLVAEWEERPPSSLVDQCREGRVKAGFRALAERLRGKP